jgi:hypothetical protein
VFGVAVWVVVWWPALFGGRVVYHSDAANHNMPVRLYVGRSLAEGHVPEWCPAMFRGIPLAGQQASEWCPSTWLMALPVPDKARLFTILTAAVYLLAWYGQWLLGMRLGLAPWAAALAATAFACCSSLPARHVFINMLEVMVALPWVVLGADVAARDKGRRSWAGTLLVALATGWMLVAFYPQIILFVLAAAVGFGLVSGRWCGGWGRIAAGAAVGLMLGLPQILPFAELVRWNGASEPRGYDYLMRYAPRARALVASVLPGLWGRSDVWLGGGNYHEGCVALGSAVACLSIAALFVRRCHRRFPRVVLLVVAVVAVCLSFPHTMPLYRLIANWPVIGSMRAMGRWWFVAAWALSLVAAWAAQEAVRLRAVAKVARRVGLAVGGAALVFVVAVSALSVGENAAALERKLGSRAGVVETLALLPGHWAHEYGLLGAGTWALLVGVGAIVALPWLRRKRGLAPAVVLLAVAIEGTHVVRLSVPLADQEAIYGQPWAATVVGRGPVVREPGDLSLWTAGQARREATDPAVQSLDSALMIENRPLIWDVAEADGYKTKVLLPRDLMELLRLAGHRAVAPAVSGEGSRRRAVVLGLLGARYLVGKADTRLDVPGLALVAERWPARAWRVEYAQPPARIAGVRQFAKNGAEARALTAEGGPAVIGGAVVEAPEQIARSVARDGEGTATVARALPGYWHVIVDTPIGGLLVVADRAYPGWHAFLDGKPAWWGRAYGTLKCMAVPAGKHHAQMVYWPTTVVLGVWGATTGLALMAAMFVLAVVPRRLTAGTS